MQIPRAHCKMVQTYVVLALVVGKVLLAGVPTKRVHFLSHLITNPKILHFHCTQLLTLDSIFANAKSCGIIAMNRHFRLRMPHIGQCLLENDAILAIVEEGTEFGFRS
jgi:hypothetical protein